MFDLLSMVCFTVQHAAIDSSQQKKRGGRGGTGARGGRGRGQPGVTLGQGRGQGFLTPSVRG